MVKIADFGMAKDVYDMNYYRETDEDTPKPIRWMAPECLREGVYNSKTEVVSSVTKLRSVMWWRLGAVRRI